MLAFKLFREKSNGAITSLFANKSRELPVGVWLSAENHPVNGLKERPYWHCTDTPFAPHLTDRNRVWAIVEMDNHINMVRPASQGEKWYLSDAIKIVKIMR